MIALDRQALTDLCMGATVLGTGGGGSPVLGIQLLEAMLDGGKSVQLASPEEVPDGAIVVMPSFVGSIAPGPKDDRYRQAMREKILTPDSPLLVGLHMLEAHLGSEAFATLAVEMGGLNTAVAGVLAALAGIPFVDGDTIGRAKPELEMGTYTLSGIPLAPMALCDVWGNRVLVVQTESSRAAEQIARALSVVGGGTVNVRCPVTGKDLRRMVVRGTVSKAIGIGRRLREACAIGQDPVAAIIEEASGTWLFQGRVSRFTGEDRGGFLWGDYWLQGTGRSEGHTLRIWLKNENELSWLDDQPFVMTPDLLCAVETKTGQPFTNSDLREGLEMVVFGVPADPIWRTPEGLALTGPEHFNFDLTYQPMEEVLSAGR
ncbi:MAG TPA: DUF917 domain-containing protein [archaeon]|nr:DUF917 domain-containing protein [archaeon]